MAPRLLLSIQLETMLELYFTEVITIVCSQADAVAQGSPLSFSRADANQ